jgi:neutral ceramidase
MHTLLPLSSPLARWILFYGSILVGFLPAIVSAESAESSQHYLIGRGIADVTGPPVGVALWGFGRPDQIGEGIHTRLRSRAFVIAEATDPDNRLVFVSADLGSIDHHIALEVVERLQRRFGQLYHLDNVIITATHTHSGSGGYWQSRTATGLDGGLYPDHFDAISNGITASIVKAHDDLQPGNIYINSGHVKDAGANRSLVAYMENPAGERARYPENTNTEMTLLKFVDDSGEIGMINWYALHPTAMNFYNRLISGDHKGYASLKMEQEHGVRYNSADDFVAAFAQSDPGDVTPNTNLDNTGPGATDVETTQIMGERQLRVARKLFTNAQELLQGEVESRRVYADLSNYEVQDQFTLAGIQNTCPSAYGYSFAGGSTEDGGGHFLFREGMTEQKIWLDWLIRFVTGAPKWSESVRACQSPKPILFETGTGNPPLQSQIRSVTLARIGQLVIVALPAEVTTMAGRRLRETVMAELGDWARYIVLSGYANGYAGYVTTPEEYMLQQYEAGHVLHGRWSLPAYQQIVTGLARDLESGAPPSSAQIPYDDWRGKSVGQALPGGGAGNPSGDRRLGDAISLGRYRYKRGETAVAQFWSSNPTTYFTLHEKEGTRAFENFLLIEHNTPEGWRTVADDGDWTTRVSWQDDDGAFLARLSWDIPEDSSKGEYRFRHLGFDSNAGEFSAVSETIHIE